MAKLDPNGALAFSTYLGGSGAEGANGIRADALGDVYVAGSTNSPDFPATAQTFNPTQGDGFVSQLSGDGATLLASTYFSVEPLVVQMDPLGDVYVAGSVTEDCLPTTLGAHQIDHGGSQGPILHMTQAWVAKFDATLSRLEYCSYYGATTANETVSELVVDDTGHAILAFQSSFSNGAGTTVQTHMVKFNVAATDLVWIHNFGSSVSRALGLATEPDDTLCVVGVTNSTSFPATAGSFQPNLAGGKDGFVARLADPANALKSVEALPAKITHGGTGQIILTLNGSAPPGGANVQLSASPAGLLTMPASVTIPAGAASVAVGVTATLVAVETPVTVTAQWLGTRSTPLTIWHGPYYDVQMLVTATQGRTATATGINDAGQVVGTWQRSASSEYYRFSPATGITVLGFGLAEDVNDMGQITGPGVFRYTDGVGEENLGSGLPHALNNNGDVVGSWTPVRLTEPFLYTDAGGQRSLPPMPAGGSNTGYAYDINDQGHVVGQGQDAGFNWKAFRYRPATGMQDLGTLPGFGGSVAMGINEQGQVAGYAMSGPLGELRAFRFSDTLGLEDLGTLPGDDDSFALAIAEDGTVLGHSRDGINVNRAVLWDLSNQIFDLADLADPFQVLHKNLEFAEDQNDAGQVVVSGTYRDALCDGSNLANAGYLLNPIGPRSSLYGSGWPGTLGVPSLALDARPVVCTNLSLLVGNSAGQATQGWLVWGTAPAQTPTPWDGELLVSPPRLIKISIPANGLTLSGTLPCDPNLLGTSVYLQVLQQDPGASRGFSFSRGLAMDIN